MKLDLVAVVDTEQIAAAAYARGIAGVRTSPAERAVWRAVDAAREAGAFDPVAHRLLTAVVPDRIWDWMERFADGGTFPRVRFDFSLESRESGLPGIEMRAARNRAAEPL